jgi:hypothetical protein
LSRKFTAGRQSDMLLNEKLHNLYTHLEFISYKDGENNTITMPKQTRQTAIPKGALWLQQPNESQVNKLRVHTNPEASDVDTRWPCLFEGYYHPATLTELPTNPVHGQLWVDDKNILRIYNDKGAEGQWVPVATELVANVNYDVFNGMDFQSIDPLLPNKSDDTMYSVPYESFGKFYAAKSHEDEFIYCHPSMDTTIASKIPSYNMLTNEGSIEIQGDTLDYLAKAWVHVNPYNLNRITKRLIKINKPEILYKTAESCINIPKSYSEDENNKNKTFSDCLSEYIIEKTNELGDTIKVVYVDENNRLVDTMDIDGEMPTEIIVLEVVPDNTKLSEYDMNTMVKASIANNKKYNETITLEVGEYVVPVEFKNQYTYFIGVPAGKTEYFAFKSSSKRGFDNYGNRVGRFLKHYNLKEGLSDEIVNNDPTILDHRNDYEEGNVTSVMDGNIMNFVYEYLKYLIEE